MKEITVDKLKSGDKFMIKSYNLKNKYVYKLKEMGLLSTSQILMEYKSIFGAVVVRCNGVKYALSRNIAKKLVAYQL